MRVKQLYQSFKWLHTDQLIAKYDLQCKKNIYEPVLFFGCYGRVHVEKALSWKAPVIIWWSGSDILIIKDKPDLVNRLRNNTNIQHIAPSNFIEDDLIELNLPYKRIPLFTRDINSFTPYKLGDSIFVYHPGSKIYCPKPIYKRIKEEFSSTNFIEAQNHHSFSQRQLLDVYKKSFLSLRFTKHDGLSHTACESGLRGRKLIWNGDTPNAINYTTDDSILTEIENVIKNKYDPFQVSEEMHNYLDVGEDWLNL